MRHGEFSSKRMMMEVIKEKGVSMAPEMLPDGYEALSLALQMILSSLHNPQSLRPSSPFFVPALQQLVCLQLDLLLHQPLLFDDLMELLATIARSSSENAMEVYATIQNYNCSKASWPVFATALHRCVVEFRSLRPGISVLDEDYSGLASILSLYAGLLSDSAMRTSLLEDRSTDLLSSCLQLLPLPLPLQLTAAVCNVLAECARDKAAAQTLWRQLEGGCYVYGARLQGSICGVVLPQAGLQQALEREESARKRYPLTRAFLGMFRSLLTHLRPEFLLHSPILFPYLSFCVQDVFGKMASRRYEEEEEKYEMLSLCVDIIHASVSLLKDEMEEAKTSPPQDTCIHALLAELLSASSLTNSLLDLHLLSPFCCPSSLPSPSASFPPSERSWRLFTIGVAAKLTNTLLFFTSQRLQALGLLQKSQRFMCVQPLAQQLLANPGPSMQLLLRLCDATQPVLQSTTLQILGHIARQVPSASLVSFFAACPKETRMIAKACELILRQALTNADDTEDGTALSLLQILEEQAHISGASLTSLLFEFPTTAAAATEPPKDGLLQTLFLFLASPAKILRHIQLASWGIRLLSALCTTPNEWRGWIQALVLEHETSTVLCSTLPYLLSCYLSSSFSTQTSLVSLTDLSRESILVFVTTSARLVAKLLFVMQRAGDKEGIASLLQAVTQYDQRVEQRFRTRSDAGSPLMDVIIRIPEFVQQPPILSPVLSNCSKGLECPSVIQGQHVVCIQKDDLPKAARRYCEEQGIRDVSTFTKQLCDDCDQVGVLRLIHRSTTRRCAARRSSSTCSLPCYRSSR